MMLIARHYVEPVQINAIKLAVKKHGFYSAYCKTLIAGLNNHADLIEEIKKIALKADLLVTFNQAQDICIFEANAFK